MCVHRRLLCVFDEHPISHELAQVHVSFKKKQQKKQVYNILVVARPSCRGFQWLCFNRSGSYKRTVCNVITSLGKKYRSIIFDYFHVTEHELYSSLKTLKCQQDMHDNYYILHLSKVGKKAVNTHINPASG